MEKTTIWRGISLGGPWEPPLSIYRRLGSVWLGQWKHGFKRPPVEKHVFDRSVWLRSLASDIQLRPTKRTARGACCNCLGPSVVSCIVSARQWIPSRCAESWDVMVLFTIDLRLKCSESRLPHLRACANDPVWLGEVYCTDNTPFNKSN